ncbi:MAG: hypothetical protein IPM84_03455 [Anaerolineae bacterium]|nr:hypothetical protein [Anaerolineae bacterium]
MKPIFRFFAFFFILTGLFIGGVTRHVVPGMLAGILVGIPIALAIATRKISLATASLVGFVLVATLIILGRQAFIGAALVSSVTFLVTNILMADELRGLFGGSLLRALKYQIDAALGASGDPQVVHPDGSVRPVNSEKTPGPRVVVLRPGAAAVFEKPGCTSRISGPGVLLIDPLEWLVATYSLSPVEKTITLNDVLTENWDFCTVTLDVRFSVSLHPDVASGRVPFSQSDKDVIQKLNAASPRWEKTEKRVLNAVETAARELFAHYVLPGARVDSNGPVRLATDLGSRWGKEIAALASQYMGLPIRLEYIGPRIIQPSPNAIKQQQRLRTEAIDLDTGLRRMITFARGYQAARNEGIKDEHTLLQLMQLAFGKFDSDQIKVSGRARVLVARLKLDGEFKWFRRIDRAS